MLASISVIAGRALLCHPSLKTGHALRANSRALSQSHKEWEKAHLSGPQRGAEMPLNVTRRQRRIIYRSKQRGWLELDILFGSWAAKNVPNMTDEAALSEIERLLDADTPDVLKWVLKQQDPPSAYDNETMRSIQTFASGEGHVMDR